MAAMSLISPGRKTCFGFLENVHGGESSMSSSATKQLLPKLLHTIETNLNGAQMECCICELADVLQEFNPSDVVELERGHTHEVVLKAMTTHELNSTVQEQGIFVLSKLVDLSENIRSQLESHQHHRSILQVMSNFSQNVCIQALGCKLITDLAGTCRVKNDLISRGAVDVILEAVETFITEEELQSYALPALSKLLTDEEKLANRVSDVLITTVMKSLMDSGDIQEQACKLLCETSKSDESCASMMHNESFVVILEAMRRHYDLSQLQAYGCDLLFQLARFEASQRILIEHQTDEVVLMALRQHRKNTVVQTSGLSTMALLAKYMTEEDLQCCGLLHNIFYAMVTLGDNPGVLHAGYCCLCELIDRCPSIITSIEEEVDKIPLHAIMVALMLHPDDAKLCQVACKAVASIADNSEVIQEALVSKGIFLAILQAMQRHGSEGCMQQWGSCALRRLVKSNSKYKVGLMKEGALQHIIAAMCSFPKEAAVQEEVIGIIACLATGIKFVRHQCATEQVHHRIITAMREFHERVPLIEMSLEALGVLAEAEELPELILESDGMAAVLDAMNEHLNEPAIQQKCCVFIQVLARFLSDEQCQSSVTALIKAMCLFPDDRGVQAEGCVAMFVIAQIDSQKSQILVNNCAHERLFFVLEKHADVDPLPSLASQCLVYLGMERDLKAHMLLSACAGGLLRAVQCLVEMGADVNAGKETNTPLCAACKNSNEEVVQFLLLQGISDVQGALRLSLEMGHNSVVGILLQHIGHEREAGIITWSRLSLGALHPEWISPALSGKSYTCTSWTGFMEDAEWTMRKRATISNCLTSMDVSHDSSPEDSPCSMSSMAKLSPRGLIKDGDSTSEYEPSELHIMTDGELTDVSPLRARSLSGASLPFSPLDPRVVSASTDSSAVIIPQSVPRRSAGELSTDPDVTCVSGKVHSQSSTERMDASISERLDLGFCASPELCERPEYRRRKTTGALDQGLFQMPSHSFFYSPDSQSNRSRSVASLSSETATGTLKVNPLATIRLLDVSDNGIPHLNFLADARPQLLTHLSNVEKLDLSRNKLSEFPPKLCNAMPKLEHVNLSRNEFGQFPFCLVQNNRLKVINLSHNKIDALSDTTTSSLFLSVDKLDLSHNTLSKLPEWATKLFPSLSSLNVAHNDITELPRSSLNLLLLKTLNLSHNKITQIPEVFLSECFHLEELSASSNRLTALPDTLAPSLAKLKVLRLADNKLVEKAPYFVPRFVLVLPSLRMVDLAGNDLVQLPSPKEWSTEQLKELDAANNKIKKWTLHEGVEKWASLERLVLSGNNLKHVPKGIGQLSALTSLDLSFNPLSYLPDEMGSLSNLWDLQLNGLNLELNASLLEGNKRELIDFLRHKLKNTVPYYRLKIVLVGPPGRGKSTLLSRLQGEKFEDGGTDVEVREWRVRDSKATCRICHRKCVRYTISAWEINGRQDHHSVLQCLLSTRTLYLLIYNVSLGTQEIEKLRPWLLSLHACAPEASVMLVGTHRDKVAKEHAGQLLGDIKEKALSMCSAPGFPQVKSHVVLNCTEEDSGVTALRCRIVELMVKCKCKGRSLVGIHVPQNYIQLQDVIQREAKSPDRAVPVLRRADVRRLIQENDLLMDGGELDNAVRFLHEAGVLVHYDDPGSQLSDLYFIDPKWLYHVISNVAAAKGGQNLVTNGVITREDLGNLLKDRNDTRLPTDLIPQFLRLLQRYDVVLPLNADQSLVPSQLGPMPCSLGRPLSDPGSLVRRVYVMPFVPMGFWARLIARLLSFVPTMCTDIGAPQEQQHWRDGISVTWASHVFFMVRRGEDPNQVAIVASHNQSGCRLLCSVIDHVDSLLDEWFPQLDTHGDHTMIKKLVPCVVCDGKSSHAFSLEQCIELANVTEYITCPKTTVTIPLQQVAPDVLMGDERLLIDESDLALVQSRDYLLGDGGHGAVYRAKYRGKAVAVKLFHGEQGSNSHRMLRQEVMFLSQLRHPSIISLVGVSVKPRALVLELAPLCSLKNLLNSDQPLGRGIQHRIAMQVVEGLAFLHEHMIVYRDLKPHNILVFSVSLGILVNAKISDFGIAGYATPYGLTAAEGTAGYRAPEVARGDVAYNKEVDLYSLGMVLYELVTGGRKPFEELRFRCELDAAVLQGRALDPITTGGCPPWPDMADLIEHLLEANPDKRPTAQQAYERLCNAEFLCLKREVAVCEGQTVECMTVRHYTEKDEQKMEVWMGSGLSDVTRGQVSWTDVTDAEGCRGTLLEDRRVTSIAAVHSDLVLVGTQSGSIHVFDAYSHSYLGCLFITFHAVVCLRHHLNKESDLVFAGLASGQLLVFDVKNLRALKAQPIEIDLCRSREACADCTQHPVACMAGSHRRVYCGCGNEVILLHVSGKITKIENRWSVQNPTNPNGLVLNIAVGTHLWTSTRDSPRVDFWDHNTTELLGTVDLKAILKNRGFRGDVRDMRVVSLLLQRELWVGLGSGHVILVDPLTQQPLSIIKRHASAVRCMVDARRPDFGKPVSLVLTGGLGFVERPGCEWKKVNTKFGYVLMWEAEICEQAKYLKIHNDKRKELASDK